MQRKARKYKNANPGTRKKWMKHLSNCECRLPPAALQRLRGWDNVEGELTEMRLEEQSERAEGRLSVLSLLSQRSLRWQLVSIIVMNMGQQLSGVNAVSPATHTVCRQLFFF